MGVANRNMTNLARQRNIFGSYFDRSGAAVTKGLLFTSARRFYVRKCYVVVSGVEAIGASASTVSIGKSSTATFDDVLAAGSVPALSAAGTVVDLTASLLLKSFAAGTTLIWKSAQVAEAGEFTVVIEVEFPDDNTVMSPMGIGS